MVVAVVIILNYIITRLNLQHSIQLTCRVVAKVLLFLLEGTVTTRDSYNQMLPLLVIAIYKTTRLKMTLNVRLYASYHERLSYESSIFLKYLNNQPTCIVLFFYLVQTVMIRVKCFFAFCVNRENLIINY